MKNLKKITFISIKIFLAIFFTTTAILFVKFFIVSKNLQNKNPQKTELMKYRENINKFKILPVKFINYKKIDTDFIKMIIFMEDPAFWKHHGIHIPAILLAIKVDFKTCSFKAGGSTITQQLAKNMFLSPKRTFFRKYMESIAAIAMEKQLSKERIIELYLNYIEFGKGIFGIKNATEYYFRKKINRLTFDEKTSLIAIIANPVKYNIKNFKQNKHLLFRYNFLHKKFQNKKKKL